MTWPKSHGFSVAELRFEPWHFSPRNCTFSPYTAPFIMCVLCNILSLWVIPPPCLVQSLAWSGIEPGFDKASVTVEDIAIFCTEPLRDGGKALIIHLTCILLLSRLAVRQNSHWGRNVIMLIVLAISHHVISRSPCINIAFFWKITLLLVPIKQNSEFPVNTAPGLLAVLHKYGRLLAERMHIQEALDWISHRLAALVGT